MTGWDRARRHRENACEQEYWQQAEAEGLRIQTQQRQGLEMGPMLGSMTPGVLIGRPSRVDVLSIQFGYSAGAVHNV